MVTAVKSDGEPSEPPRIKTMYVNQLGYLVRENIPIKYKLWKAPKKNDDPNVNVQHIVPETKKEMLWE